MRWRQGHLHLLDAAALLALDRHGEASERLVTFTGCRDVIVWVDAVVLSRLDVVNVECGRGMSGGCDVNIRQASLACHSSAGALLFQHTGWGLRDVFQVIFRRFGQWREMSFYGDGVCCTVIT